MKAFDKIVLFLQGVIKFVVSLNVLVLCIMTFLQVILRYVFSTGITWTDELCRFLFVYIIFLILPYASLHNTHMQLDVVSSKAPSAKPFLRVLAWVVEFVFFTYMIRNGYDYALTNVKKIASSVKISYMYIYMIIPVCCAMGDVFLFYRLAKVIQLVRSGVSLRSALSNCMPDDKEAEDEEELLLKGDAE